MSFEIFAKMKHVEETVAALYRWQRLPWYRRILKKLPPPPSAEDTLESALKEAVLKAGLFDVEYYLKTYPDVASSGLDPLDHFARYGCQERRKPSPLFDPLNYLAAHPELDPVTTNPFQHFLIHRLQRRILDKDLPDIHQDQEVIALNKQLLQALKGPDITESDVINKLAKIRLQSFLNKEGFSSFWTATHDPTENPLVSVIYILYGKAELLLPTLESLISECEVGLEVIVIDNASSDDTHELLRHLPGVRSILNAENKGFIAAANQGGAIARGKYLLFLNNDTILQIGSIRSALKTIQQADNIGVVGGKIILLNGTLQEAGSILFSDGSTYGYGRGDDPFDPRYMYQRDVVFCSGCFFLTPRDLFLKVGGFDLDYAPAYYEDLDYCLRLKALGYRTVYDPQAELFHYEHGSSNREKVAEMMLKNRARLLERHSAFVTTLAPPGDDWAKQSLQAYDKPKHLLYMLDHFPFVINDLWDVRKLQIIEGYASLGWQVTVIHPGERIIWNKVRKSFPATVRHSLMKEAELATALSRYDKVISPFGFSKILDQSDKAKLFIDDEIKGLSRVPISFESISPAPFSDRDGFLIATDHYNFSEAQGKRLAWFLEEIYPILERHGLRTVRVLGALPSSFNKSRYPLSVEFVNDDKNRADSYQKSRCLVVPFASAAESILTLWQAACFGLPVVMRDEAAREVTGGGFSGFKSSSCVDNEQFASVCSEVAQNEELWQSLQLSGLSRGREECSRERFLSRLRESF